MIGTASTRQTHLLVSGVRIDYPPMRNPAFVKGLHSTGTCEERFILFLRIYRASCPRRPRDTAMLRSEITWPWWTTAIMSRP